MTDVYLLVKVRNLPPSITPGAVYNSALTIMEDVGGDLTIQTLDATLTSADPLARLRASMDSGIPNLDYEDVEAVMNELTVARSQNANLNARMQRIDDLLTQLLDRTS